MAVPHSIGAGNRISPERHFGFEEHVHQLADGLPVGLTGLHQLQDVSRSLGIRVLSACNCYTTRSVVMGWGPGEHELGLRVLVAACVDAQTALAKDAHSGSAPRRPAKALCRRSSRDAVATKRLARRRSPCVLVSPRHVGGGWHLTGLTALQ